MPGDCVVVVPELLVQPVLPVGNTRLLDELDVLDELPDQPLRPVLVDGREYDLLELELDPLERELLLDELRLPDEYERPPF